MSHIPPDVQSIVAYFEEGTGLPVLFATDRGMTLRFTGLGAEAFIRHMRISLTDDYATKLKAWMRRHSETPDTDSLPADVVKEVMA